VFLFFQVATIVDLGINDNKISFSFLLFLNNTTHIAQLYKAEHIIVIKIV